MDYNTDDHDDVVFDDPDTAYTPVNAVKKSRMNEDDIQRKILDEMRRSDSDGKNHGEMKSPWESSQRQESVRGTKNKTMAGLLGIFLGAFGIHNFYIGRTSRGLVQLLISVLSGGTLSFIPEVWGLVEGVLIISSKRGSKWHKDGQGKELID